MAELNTEPTSIMDLLDDPVESPSDVAEESGSLPDASGLNDGQSESLTEQVAPDAESDELDTEGTDAELAASDVPTSEAPPVAAYNWDSDENPYRAQAQAFAELQQLAAQKEADDREKANRERWSAAFQKLPDVDEDDLPALTDQLIGDIQEHARKPMAERIDVLEHGFTAVVAALEAELSPAQVEAVKKRAAIHREMAPNARDLDHSMRIARQVANEYQEREKAKDTEIANLKAQLAAKAITESGVNRSETASVGARDTEITSWDQLLEGRI